MVHEETPDFSVALDLGSSRASILVAQPGSTSESLNVLAYATLDTSGMRKGHIVHFDSLVTTIQELVDEAERQTGLSIENVRLNIAGPAASYDNYTESAQLRHGEVRPADVERLHSSARAMRPGQGFDFIHNLATQFSLDGKSGLVSPVGLLGSSLSCIYHRVSFPQNDLRNLVKACNQAGLHVESFVFEALAAAEAVLDPDEQDLGSACIAIGHDLTHVSVYAGGHPVFSKGFPFGSNHITKDLSVGLRLTQSEAEKLKRDFGQAVAGSDGATDLPLTEDHTGRSQRLITKSDMTRIVAPRVTEILEAVRDELKRTDLLNSIPKGFVLTGGGALLKGICLAAEDVFQTHARIGQPFHVQGLTEGLRTPAAASLVGILARRFASPQEEPTWLERVGALKGPGGVRAFARGLWEKIAEPFE